MNEMEHLTVSIGNAVSEVYLVVLLLKFILQIKTVKDWNLHFFI